MYSDKTVTDQENEGGNGTSLCVPRRILKITCPFGGRLPRSGRAGFIVYRVNCATTEFGVSQFVEFLAFMWPIWPQNFLRMTV